MGKLSDSEVLTTCIERAVNGGYEIDQDPDELAATCIDGWENCVERIIFEHDFAKSLWGEDEINVNNELPKSYWEAVYGGTIYSGLTALPSYFIHLQQLAVAPDRIQYLREWLEEQK